MQLHELKRNNPNRKKKRVGRGGKRGKTSGRGHKGQKQHGGTPRPVMRDIIKKLPKRRGYGKNRARTVNPNDESVYVVNLSVLDKNFSDGDTISPKTISEKGLSKKSVKAVKVLSEGTLSKKYKFEGCTFSETAREKVLKSGSKIK